MVCTGHHADAYVPSFPGDDEFQVLEFVILISHLNIDEFKCGEFCNNKIPHSYLLQQESRRAYGTAVSRGSHPSELNSCQMVQQSKVQSSRFPATQQSNHPKSNHPDFQTCNVRFTESDHLSTAGQPC